MSGSVADLFVVLDSVTEPFSAGMKKAAADAESQSHRMSGALGLAAKAAVGVSIAAVGIGVASVKAATDFQQQMTRLSTAAGAPKAAVQAASGAILAMGTQVGMTGTQMAEALYHPISAGLDMATSLQVVKQAAMEAQISGASLDDTTYSLSSVMKAFNYPASQAANTMSLLNAVVGDGDMRFQDFNVSVKNWAPTAAQMGISIQSMGAGLAYLTDRGNSAEEASTRLTMGLSMMTTPSQKAAGILEGLGVASSDVKASTAAMTEVLKASGVTQNQLAADLAKPDGLYIALKQLKDALHNAGVGGTEADSAIAKVFGGGRSDKAILSLLQNLDGLKQKYDQIGTDSTPAHFQAAWEQTRKTFGFQLTQMKVAAENFGIELGSKLLPVLSNVISTGEGDLGQLVSGFTGAASKPVQHPNAGNALLNKDLATPPPLTGWQKFGEQIHRYVTDIETDAKKLRPVADNFIKFGTDVLSGVREIVPALEPTAKLLGGVFLGALSEVGKILANTVGPAFKSFADFLSSHQQLIEYFAVTVLGGLALKMSVLGTINATKGLIDLATKIVSFPLGQLGEIKTAMVGVKTAWTGKEAADGEKAIQGLSGAVGDLKGKATGLFDNFPLFKSGNVGEIEKAATGIGDIEKAAASGGEQLGLFETNMQGIVQVADHQQLELFSTELGGVATEAQTAETASGSLLGKIGGFAMTGGIIVGALAGIGMLADQLGKLMGVGDHTALSMDQLSSSLQLSSAGSVAARAQFTQTAVSMVAMSEAEGAMGMQSQGLKDVDSSLTQLVTSGHAQDAQAQFQDIAAALAKQGINAQAAAAKFPQYEQAIKNAGDEAQTTDGKLTQMQNTLAAQESLTSYNQDLATLKQQLHDSGNSMSKTNQTGLENQRMFQQLAGDVMSYYQNQRTAGTGTQSATNDMVKQVQQVEALGKQFGINKSTVDQYLGSLAKIKPQYSTTVTLNTRPAFQALNGLIQSINNSTGVVQVTASSSNPAGGKAYTYDEGGFVPGPRGMAQVAIVHGGEYVVSNAMQAGSQAVDPRVLAGVGAGSGRMSGSGAAPGMTVYNIMNVNIAGDLTTQDRTLAAMRTAQGQWSRRNGGTTGWSTTR